MEHNLDFGPEAQANHSLAVLRAQSLEKAVSGDERFSPGVFVGKASGSRLTFRLSASTDS